MTSPALKFALNLIAAIVIFVAFRSLLSLVPAFSEPVLAGWGMAEILALFIALYLVRLARRRIPMFRITMDGK